MVERKQPRVFSIMLDVASIKSGDIIETKYSLFIVYEILHYYIEENKTKYKFNTTNLYTGYHPGFMIYTSEIRNHYTKEENPEYFL